ncbi:MAG: DUF1501 domain-containing protein [Parahaliea sp.]
MKKQATFKPVLKRRKLLKIGLGGLGLGVLGRVPATFAQTAQSLAEQAAAHNKVLIVLELSGGNDGLNTVVPYGDDAYYRHRPNIGIAKDKLRIIDEHFGFNTGMTGFERLYKEGKMAIVHACGYDNPSYSHFTSMAYWHTAAPNSGQEYGWLGRLADHMAPDAPSNYLVNIAARQSLAVHSQHHVPVVFDKPERFAREVFHEEKAFFNTAIDAKAVNNPSRRFLLDIARSANDTSALVRQAWQNYKSPVDYGVANLDLPKVIALLESGMPANLFYLSFRNNAFDTHVFQNDLHQRLLMYTADAVSAFVADLERIQRADDVVIMVFSEFGRRVPENVSLGTDHGAANTMFVIGKPVKGGHYGEKPNLAILGEGDNLKYTTDFRKVYQTMIEGWLGSHGSPNVLAGDFGTFDMFA